MGLFWDLIQQSQISSQSSRADSLETRMQRMEQELHETQQLMQKLLERLEKHFGTDIDGDGRVGPADSSK